MGADDKKRDVLQSMPPQHVSITFCTGYAMVIAYHPKAQVPARHAQTFKNTDGLDARRERTR